MARLILEEDITTVAANTKWVQVPLVIGSNFGIDPKISGAKVYNLFTSDGFLIGTPGWKKRLTLVASGSTPVAGRGIFKSERGPVDLSVVNQTVWTLDKTTGATFAGNLTSSKGLVSMAENLNGQICIVDGTSAYIYNRFTRALTKQTLPDWLIPNYVSFQNTYFLIGNGDSTGNGARWGIFTYTTDNTISLFQEGALETKADYARAVIPIPGKSDTVLVFGEGVTEVQADVGGLQVYARVSSLNVDYGVASIHTIASNDTMVVWLAINAVSPPVIMYFDGKTHQTISSDGINHLMDLVKFPNQSVGFLYKRAGHLLYQLTCYNPQDNFSLLYDFNTKRFQFITDADLNYHPAVGMIYSNNTNYFVSLNNGCLYETGLEFTTYNENVVGVEHPNFRLSKDRIIPRQLITDTFRFEPEETGFNSYPTGFSVNSFSFLIKQGAEKDYSQAYAELDVTGIVITEEGAIVETEDGDVVITEGANVGTDSTEIKYEPAVDLSISMDGAESWSNEVRRTMHYLGHRKNTMPWDALGYMNEITYKLKIWSYGQVVLENGTMLLSK